jgi:endonuclease/exonuclease/phosphatase family metal-dependent hydrolase
MGWSFGLPQKKAAAEPTCAGDGTIQIAPERHVTAQQRQRLPQHLLRALRQEALRLEGRIQRRQASPKAGTVVASYNIHKCVGTDKLFDPSRIVQVISELGADVVALQEADQRFGERAALLDFKTIERECGLTAVPVRGAKNGHGWHGNVLLVRAAKVHDAHRIRLPGVEPRGALVVDLELDAGPLRIVAAHLGLLRRSRAQQAAAILDAITARPERPTLLVGDLNEWRVCDRSALQRLGHLFGPLAPALPSFPSRLPLFALDRILGSPHHLIAHLEVHDTPLARVASDHLPVKARIDLAAVAAQGATEQATIAA